ncbi:voltage-dependent calcium channel subunit alpha-2/delta-3 isoform X2 [Amyelois transitella]|uniref:voltage-dependent calcium channel subunit alpha-2/delta-3 isoform X2 n=1 Tax=Amyelois transitella TaxID=680683 RepID=UPI00298FA280|nr:voltage-dependent calcium channel subunit alpha-2/delta-3 isoform X2 [Amyelois transitella]
MNSQYLIILILIINTNGLKHKKVNKTEPVKVSVNKSEVHKNVSEFESVRSKKGQKVPTPPPPTTTEKPIPIIPPEMVQEWAQEISEMLFQHEDRVVRRKELLEKFSDIKIEERNGFSIVQKMAKDLEDLLTRRTRAAERIGRHAEALASSTGPTPRGYTYFRSEGLNELKTKQYPDSKYEMRTWCRSLYNIPLKKSLHFDGDISLEASSVYVAVEVFDCVPPVKEHLYWSEGLISTFKENYAQDATMDFQYFCSAKGFLRHYPAALWSSMYQLHLEDEADVYDCRLRPWYVAAAGAPRDILILLDASGSMNNSFNSIIAEKFTLAFLSALTDDDQVNVLRFNVIVESPISCFNEKLVPANHVNSAAMMAALKDTRLINETNMKLVLTYAVEMLQRQQKEPDHPPACQQAIVLVADCIDRNFTELMKELDPKGHIRLFVLWLHDIHGLRDNTRAYADQISCDRDGYFAELTTHADVTEQVIQILRVLERPLVSQRKERLKVFSDVYAHVEDPRRAELYWQLKENAEQMYRYKQLRKDKKALLNSSRLMEDYLHQETLDTDGHYYEGEEIDYRLQISVSVPVFDFTTVEEKQRISTRTYPVNRLLGVAGVDIPIDHLKLILPYYQLGGGGDLFVLDHRGNIVLHDNLKPVLDGDILKPGYRTVDFSEMEQAGVSHPPRRYPQKWRELRKALVLDQTNGSRTILAKNIFDGGMRARVEQREYHWQRVLEHYTAVVVIPASYNRRRAVPAGVFTQKLAAEALKTLSRSEFSIHPQWLYCRHVEPRFTTREDEVRHFVRRRSEEPNFAMKKTDYFFSSIGPGLFDEPYQCNEELMARLCKEAVATAKWADEHEDPDSGRDCSNCELGSVTAFFASESGLTRWQQYHATTSHLEPPDGSVWPGGPSETWYKRAVSFPDTLVIHAPVTPYRKMRNSDVRVRPVGERSEWLTAARTLGTPAKGTVGVAGFHFHPRHMEDVLRATTNFPCTSTNKDKCEVQCDGIIWSCVVIDEGAWIVAGDLEYERKTTEYPVRRHLAAVYPAAMSALLNHTVYRLNWIHDYQAVCFPRKDSSAAIAVISTLLKSFWCTAIVLFHLSKEIGTFFTLLGSTSFVNADTEEEKRKRRRRLFRDYELEKYESLYDDRVLVNRTRIAACDRSRPMYQLQDTKEAKEALKQSMSPCKWPLVAAPVPGTNLLLLAVYKLCDYTGGRAVPDPLTNQKIDMKQIELPSDIEWGAMNDESWLACWRNLEPLPGRPPHTRCYPHQYAQEAGYRQCGPWVPNPDQPEEDEEEVEEDEYDEEEEDTGIWSFLKVINHASRHSPTVLLLLCVFTL